MKVRILKNQEKKITRLPEKKVCYILGEGAKLWLFLENEEGEVVVELRGDNSEVESKIFGAARAGDFTFKLEHRHLGRDTKSRLVQKVALSGGARANLTGTVRMESGCSGANGVVEQHSLLLSPDARVEAKPVLEIGHHEVKASHAATVSRVDDEKLFYLVSRGISKREAKKLLLDGFFAGTSKDFLKILL